MWMALIDMRSDCTAMTGLIFGETLKELANSLLAETEMIWEFARLDGLSLEEIEDEYYCELDDYKRLESLSDPQVSDLLNYSCCVSDASIDVGCVVDSYDALVKAFAEYTEDKMTLDEWELVPDLTPTPDDLTEIDNELRAMSDGGEDFTYFVQKEWDEED